MTSVPLQKHVSTNNVSLLAIVVSTPFVTLSTTNHNASVLLVTKGMLEYHANLQSILAILIHAELTHCANWIMEILSVFVLKDSQEILLKTAVSRTFTFALTSLTTCCSKQFQKVTNAPPILADPTQVVELWEATLFASAYQNTKEPHRTCPAVYQKTLAIPHLADPTLNALFSTTDLLNALAFLVSWKVPTLFVAASNLKTLANPTLVVWALCVIPTENQFVIVPTVLPEIPLEAVESWKNHCVAPALVELTLIVTTPTTKNNATVDLVLLEILIPDAGFNHQVLVYQILVDLVLSALSLQMETLYADVRKEWEEIPLDHLDVLDMNVSWMRTVETNKPAFHIGVETLALVLAVLMPNVE